MTEALTSLEQATEQVLAEARTLPAEPVPLAQALGRTLATAIESPSAVPPFDNSAMDGFAVRARDTRSAGKDPAAGLRLVGESRAGAPAGAGLGDGEAIRISTGGALPAGADAVVRIEDASVDGETVRIAAPVDAGRDVRRAGEDVGVGQRLLEAGSVLGPAELGVLASVGLEAVEVHRRPELAIVISGDELVPPGVELLPGQIHDSNRLTLSAQTGLAGAELRSTRVVGDEPEALREAIRGGIEADALVVCGGVSVGPHDHTKAVLAELGVEQRFWGLALKPGRPTWFGVSGGGTLVFGLPGNPVSAMVTFALLVRPALRRMSGAASASKRVEATIDTPYPHRAGRLEAVRCFLEAQDDGWHVRPTGPQGSHILTSMLGAGALAMIEAERGDLAAGDRVTVELLDL